jgi:hypothetical protein
MKLLTTITTEDRWVIVSIALTLSGVILGAQLAEPRAFGVTAIIVIGLLSIARSVTHSARLSWLLVFGLVAGVMELWADWCMRKNLSGCQKEVFYRTRAAPPAAGLEQKRGGTFPLYTARERNEENTTQPLRAVLKGHTLTNALIVTTLANRLLRLFLTRLMTPRRNHTERRVCLAAYVKETNKAVNNEVSIGLRVVIRFNFWLFHCWGFQVALGVPFRNELGQKMENCAVLTARGY